MYRISAFFLSASLGITVWIAFEMGILSHGSAAAREGNAEMAQAPADARAKALELKEMELTRRERELKEKEALLQDQIHRYEKTMAEIKKQPKEVEPSKEQTAGELAAVYEKMDPKKASKIVEQLEVTLASQILGQMGKQRAADILGRVSSEKAKLITERLYSKRALSSHSETKSPTTGSQQ